MPYRGYLALNGMELANSARAIAHLGGDIPTNDYGYIPDVEDGSYTLVLDPDWGAVIAIPPYDIEDLVWGQGVGILVAHPEDPGLYLTAYNPCTPIESIDHPGLGLPLASQAPIEPGSLLWWPPDGARIFGPGLFIHDRCWGEVEFCRQCRSIVSYDDSWAEQREWLGDADYRVELAPWYVDEIPESGEFGGVWLMSLEGLDSTPSERTITQSAGAGAVAGPNRDSSRTVVAEALLIACSNAGVEHGLKWLTNLLRTTTKTQDLRLRYLTASPARTAAYPDTLVREVHGAVMTKEPRVTGRYNSGGGAYQHGNMYKVSWEITTLSPYAYLPSVDVAVEWDRITRQPINWIHAADCSAPETCIDMPVMFSADCVPEVVDRVQSLPPVCGGCLPVNAIDKYQFRVPTMEYAFRGRETAVSMIFKNTGLSPLTVQTFWRVCGSDVRCEDNQFPLQISGLPAGAELHLNGITGRYRAWYDELWHRPQGIVGTPNGAPWLPPVIDRQICWDFIVQASSTASFAVSMSMADREP